MAKVMIVEDSPVTRKLLKQILTDLGHTVVAEADNGTKAFVEFVNMTTKPDVVTMDLCLPGISGMATMTKILSHSAESRIIVISSAEERATIYEALERGAAHFILKPVEKEKVAKVFTEVLGMEVHPLRKEKVSRYLHAFREKYGIEAGSSEVMPPYLLERVKDDELEVLLNENFSRVSCRALEAEIKAFAEEGANHIFLIFDEISQMDGNALAELSSTAKRLSGQGLFFRGMSRNAAFFTWLHQTSRTFDISYLMSIMQQVE